MSDIEIVKDFLVESYENLDRLDRGLITLEKDPHNKEELAGIFRTIHTIKGTSGFLAFNQLEAVTHAGESLLAQLRDGVLQLTPEITTALLAMVDAVREMLASIEATGTEGSRDDNSLIVRLTSLQKTGEKSTAGPPTEPPVTDELNKTSEHPELLGEILVREGKATPDIVAEAIEQQREGDPRHIGEILVEQHAVKPQEVLEALTTQQTLRAHGAGDSTIRVDVSLLDQLMNLVGELVLTRNQILQFTNTTEESGLLGTSQRLNLITTELQEGVMKTRMQPIENIWSKFPRIVRDLAVGCGKQVRIEMEGQDTELDKTIIEAIKDPLTHLVRNAVDHGIECPDVRKAIGKSAEGCLFLRAFHEGGQVNIEITDDGQGLELSKIRDKAVQKGLITADQAGRMTERETTNLIFLAGLSTAMTVTNVSGRGVGMDVVKTNIEKIGGTVDVQSKQGQGTTVRMKIPLTLAIIPALVVTSAGDRYAIPQVSLLELVRLEGESAQKGIETIRGAPVHRLRGKLLPLVYLNRELKTGNTGSQADGLARATLDFGRSRSNHRRWRETLQQVLDGKLNMPPEEADSHEQGALGEWLYSFAMQAYPDRPEIRELEVTHRAFHNSVKEVLGLKQQGKAAEAVQKLGPVEQSLDRMLQLLNIVEKQATELQNINIVVVRADDREFGLVVDEISDTEEIVVKPLSKQLKTINAYAGATIMGDGRVALILDVMGLAQRANVISEVKDRSLNDAAADQSAKAAEANRRNARHV